MTLRRLTYVAGSIAVVLLALGVLFTGSQRQVEAQVAPQIVFCLLNDAGDPVAIFDDECAGGGGTVIPDVCPEEGLQMVGPCAGDDEDPVPGETECSDLIDNDSDGFSDFVPVIGDPDCEDISDDSESPDTPTDVCPNVDDVQETVPEGMELNDEGNCVDTPEPPTDGGGNQDDEDDDTAPTGPTGGGGSSNVTGGGSYPSGQVLGTSTVQTGIACDQYLTSFIKPEGDNDAEQVTRLQALLKDFEGMEVEVNGVYDEMSLAAVHAFQTKYAADILAPWGIPESTGFVYLTTRKKANEIYCKNTQPFPLSEEEQQIIDASKLPVAAVAAVSAVIPKHEEAPEEEEVVVPEVEIEKAAPVVDAPVRSVLEFFRGFFDRFR